MRMLAIPVDEILSIVNCAEDYGHNNSVLLDALASWVDREVSDAEIEAYARTYLTPEMAEQGYTQEDYNAVRTTGTQWRNKYCVKS